MRRHVQQVPGVGDQRAQHVGRAQRLLGVGGHLHQVDVEVEQAGMGHPAGEAERLLQHPLDLQRARARRRLAGRDVPQLPGREVHHRVGVQRGDVEVVGVARVDAGHRVGVGELERREVLDRLGPGEPLRQRVDQVALDVGRARCGLARGGDGSVRAPQRRMQVDGVEGVPVLVVVRAGGVGDAPVGECAPGIVLHGPLEAAHRLLVVEAVAPQQAAVEPRLRGGRGRRHRAGVGAEIEGIAGHATSLTGTTVVSCAVTPRAPGIRDRLKSGLQGRGAGWAWRTLFCSCLAGLSDACSDTISSSGAGGPQ